MGPRQFRVKYGDVDCSTENTTPQPYELNKILSNMRKDGVDTVIMEVSTWVIP